MLLFLHLDGAPIAPMFSDFHEGFSTHKINVTRVLAHSNQPLLDIPGGGKLQEVLRHSGCKDEKICFILDESNVMGLWLPGAHEHAADQRRGARPVRGGRATPP